MQRKAIYDNGDLIFLDESLPAGRMEVLVEFPDEEMELTDEWKSELDRRIDAIDRGEEQLIPAEEVFAELKSQS